MRAAGYSRGRGGHAAGEAAKAAVIDSLYAHNAEVDPEVMLQVLGRAVTEANREVARHAAEDPARRGMGTTLTAMPCRPIAPCSPTSVIPGRSGSGMASYARSPGITPSASSSGMPACWPRCSHGTWTGGRIVRPILACGTCGPQIATCCAQAA